MKTVSRKQRKSIKAFMKNWFTKTIAVGNHWKTVKYRNELIEELDKYISDDYLGKQDKIGSNGYFSLSQIENWDNSTDIDINGKSSYCYLLCDFFNYEYENCSCLSKKGQNDFHCAFRIAIDLFVQQSGGVCGYSVQGLLNAFDNDIETLVSLGFDRSELQNTEQGVWL